MQRRTFLTKAALAATATSTALLAACSKKEAGPAEVGAPAVATDKKTAIKWRLQTYAGPALAEHVIKPSIDAFNKAANGEMVIELYFADQLVPTGELFRAMQAGTIDAVQSDDDSMAAPADIRVFGGYFPFATRFSLDVARAVPQVGPERDLDGSLRRGRGRHLAQLRLAGTPATSTPSSRSPRSRT